MSEERLQKFLSRAGVASRRKAEAMITAGDVTVNGQRAELGMKVAEGDEVRVRGERVTIEHEPVAFAFYKPEGIVTTVSDDQGRKTVMDYLPDIPGLHPVGRLDMDSEGLLVITNDGDLTMQLSHPRYGHEKEYRVWCAGGTLSAGELAVLEQGVDLDDGPARAVVARLARGGCRLVLQEGRKRQVRRMLAAVGRRVTRLLRTRIGRLELGELQPGGYRKLNEDDYRKLGYKRR